MPNLDVSKLFARLDDITSDPTHPYSYIVSGSNANGDALTETIQILPEELDNPQQAARAALYTRMIDRFPIIPINVGTKINKGDKIVYLGSLLQANHSPNLIGKTGVVTMSKTIGFDNDPIHWKADTKPQAKYISYHFNLYLLINALVPASPVPDELSTLYGE